MHTEIVTAEADTTERVHIDYRVCPAIQNILEQWHQGALGSTVKINLGREKRKIRCLR